MSMVDIKEVDKSIQLSLLGFLLAIKPIVDGAYEFAPVRYIYIVSIAVCALLSAQDKSFRWKSYEGFCISALLMGLYYLFRSAGDLDSVGECIKIFSPFFVFFLLLPRLNRGVFSGVVLYAYLNIYINVLLVPFDFAWVMWGDFNTFKGLYYFKTDLAFSASFSLLIIFTSRGFKLDLLSAISFVMSVLLIFLANSRANYLIIGMIAFAILFVNAKNIKQFSIISITVSAVILVFFSNFDDSAQLAFDVDDQGALTQGRDLIWNVLIEQGFANYDLSQWVFGSGFFADYWLNYHAVPFGEPNNAHNDVLHLVFNYGIIGLLVVYLPWCYVIKDVWIGRVRVYQISLAITLACYFIQGLTAVMAPFASKTWGVVYILICIFYLRNSRKKSLGDNCVSVN